MVTTTYQRVAELQITLPEADAEQPKQRPKEINVGVDAQGRYVINKNVFTFTTRGGARRRAQARRGRRQGPGRDHQRRRRRDAPVGDPRDGGRPGRGVRACDVRDPGGGSQVTARHGSSSPSRIDIPPFGSANTAPRADQYRPLGLIHARRPPRRRVVFAASHGARSPAAAVVAPVPVGCRACGASATASACCEPCGSRVPVVVVGNITVGGSGKTPLVAALAAALAQRGPSPGHREPRLRPRQRSTANRCRSVPTTIRGGSATSLCCSRAPATPSSSRGIAWQPPARSLRAIRVRRDPVRRRLAALSAGEEASRSPSSTPRAGWAID